MHVADRLQRASDRTKSIACVGLDGDDWAGAARAELDSMNQSLMAALA